VFDLLSAFFFLFTSPLLILIQRNKKYFFKNILSVIGGYKSWVGYESINQVNLPKLKPAIFSPTDAIKNAVITDEICNRLNLIYSKEYKVENDLNILLKNIRFLGK
jgi:hypothetical protein